MIIGVNGVSESGKDSVGRVCAEKWDCKQLALATKMKEAALALDPIIDWKVAGPQGHQGMKPVRLSELVADVGPEMAKKHPEVRRTYQRMGTEVGREVIHEDLWVRQITPLLRKGKNYVITDVRFLNEAEMVRNHGGVVVRVERPGYGPALGHISDLGEGLWDHVIHNNGTLEDLEVAVVETLARYF